MSVEAHFPSPARAREALHAVGLLSHPAPSAAGAEEALLYRTHGSLSSGESELADLARVIVAARDHYGMMATDRGKTIGALATATGGMVRIVDGGALVSPCHGNTSHARRRRVHVTL